MKELALLTLLFVLPLAIAQDCAVEGTEANNVVSVLLTVIRVVSRVYGP